jgi:hypothetical protein
MGAMILLRQSSLHLYGNHHKLKFIAGHFGTLTSLREPGRIRKSIGPPTKRM